MGAIYKDKESLRTTVPSGSGWSSWLMSLTPEEAEAEIAENQRAGHVGQVMEQKDIEAYRSDRKADDEKKAKEAEQKKAFELETAATEAANAKQKAIAEAGSAGATKAQKSAYASQQALIDKLTAQASGKTPSLAEAQIKATGEKNLAQQLAAAGAARGGNAAALQRQLAKQQQTMGAELTQQAGQAKLQEQQQATAALQTAVAQQASMAQEAQNTYLSAYQNAIAQGFNVEQAQTQANVAYQEFITQQKQFSEQLAAEKELAQAQIASQQYMQKKQFQQQLVGGLTNAVGSTIASLAFSDRRVKKNVESADKDLKNFFESIAASKNDKVQHAANGLVLKNPNEDEDDSNEPSFFKNKSIDFNKSADENIKEEESAGLDWKGAAKTGLKSALESVGRYGSSSNFGGGISTGSKAQVLKPKAMKTFAEGGVSEDSKYSDLDIEKFLNALKAYKYDYKNPNTPFTAEGKQFSVMAQDLEKTPVGKAMVEEMEDGTKAVNYARGFGAILAAQANLNKRLSELEDKKKKSNKK